MDIEKKLSSITKNVYTNTEIRIGYSYDASGVEFRPDFVVFAEDTNEVIEISKLVKEFKIPLYPRGAGSGFVGGAVPKNSGIVLSLEKMNKILEVDKKNKIVISEAGVITGILRKNLLKENLFYPPEPSSLDFCTIGGNVNTDAGGLRTVKYGTTRRYVAGLEVVFPGGIKEILGGKFSKETAGYSIKDLIIGSEGTLGIVTKIYLKLLIPPEKKIVAQVYFKSIGDSINFVNGLLLKTDNITACEYIGPEIVNLLINDKMIESQARDSSLLLIEVDGGQNEVERGKRLIEEELQGFDVINYTTGTEEDEIERIWIARKSVSPILFKLKPTKINEDVCLPRSELKNYINDVQEYAKNKEVLLCIFGHIADGNLHLNIMTDKNNLTEFARAKELVNYIFEKAIFLKGTLSGEHGIGLLKSGFMKKRYSDNMLEYFKSIKQVFDPDLIMNPGKIFYG
ncbi:MAG: FAD-linked oxidase C-terminal domain-containing protein [Candidatus Hydrogenedentota bacterium]